MTITITEYQVDFAAGTIVFREDALKVKKGVGQPLLNASYTLEGLMITLQLDALPADLEVTL